MHQEFNFAGRLKRISNMSVGTYRVTDKKCATCNWWCGARQVQFQANRPYYVMADARPSPCQACGQNKTPGSVCLRWQKWVSI